MLRLQIVPSTLQYLSALVTTTWKDLMLTNDYMASGSAEEVPLTCVVHTYRQVFVVLGSNLSYTQVYGVS